MAHSIPEYLLISELLGYGAGTVLSIVLALLVRRSSQRTAATRLLAFCALLWNISGLLAIFFILFGMGLRSGPVNLARATSMTGGTMFPISFLLLWSRSTERHLFQTKVSRWLLWLSVVNATWITVLLFICPWLGNM